MTAAPALCDVRIKRRNIFLTAFDDIEVGVVPRPLFVQLLREMVVFIFVMFCPRQATESI